MDISVSMFMPSAAALPTEGMPSLPGASSLLVYKGVPRWASPWRFREWPDYLRIPKSQEETLLFASDSFPSP